MPPVITSIGGTKVEGGTFILSGSGFTAKPTAAPIIFEKFDGGIKNNALLINEDIMGAMAYNENVIKRPRRGFSARLDFAKRDTSIGITAAYFSYRDTQWNAYTCSYWMYLPSTWHWGMGNPVTDPDDDGLANIKIIRFMPTGSNNYTNVDISLNPPESHSVRYVYEHETGAHQDALYPDFPGGGNYASILIPGWHQFRFEYRENTGLGVADGIFRWWLNESPAINHTNGVTNEVGDAVGMRNKMVWQLGFSDSWGYDLTPTMLAYMADVVVDGSLAKVELGDSSSYDTCTRLEYQPAISWADNSITVTANYGARSEFSLDNWIYVTDINGVRSIGFQLSSATVEPSSRIIIPSPSVYRGPASLI